MAINVVNAILSGQIGLNAFKVTMAQAWSQQCKGAYNLIYPYIKEDFRGLLDCDLCHRALGQQYQRDAWGKGGFHSGFIGSEPRDDIAEGFVDKSATPIAKIGNINVGTYEDV